MNSAYLRAAVAIAALVALSACGGEGGGVTPLPAPPPPPAAAAAFPLTKTGTFDTISSSRSNHYVGGNPAIDSFSTSTGAGVTISYDAASNSYTVQNGSVSASFDPSNLTTNGYVDSYSKGSMPISDTLELYNNVRAGASQASAPVQLSYLSYGVWTHKDFTGVGQYSKSYLLFGYPTASSSMPTTGSATYKTAVSGTAIDLFQSNGEMGLGGSATFIADFGAGTINTSLNLLSLANGADLGTYNGSAAISGSNFAGNFASSDPWFVEGSFAGGFFGPTAKETGYTFAIKRGAADPYAGASVAPALSWFNGVVVGTKN